MYDIAENALAGSVKPITISGDFRGILPSLDVDALLFHGSPFPHHIDYATRND